MRSTSYFIELMIAGAGATIWLSIIVMSFYGYDWMPWDYLKEAGIIIVLSPFVYVLGVIIDRFVDNFFDFYFKENAKNPQFLPKDEYYMARTKVYMASDHLKDLMEYGKMRIRICRAWAFNSLLIAFFGSLYVISSPYSPFDQLGDKLKLGGVILLVFGLLGLLSFRAWRILSVKEAGFLRDQCRILDEMEGNKEEKSE
ncbi:MAG: hypothetical protein AAFR87_24825 [Bacteroidota bacterium]